MDGPPHRAEAPDPDADQRVRDGSPSLTLSIETPEGTFIRTVLPATDLLAEGSQRGYAAEDATRGSAAAWGLPDFVFRARLAGRASATRELGDAFLVVGELGAVLQVKARTTPGSDTERERAWLTRAIADGRSQARGTIRTMGRAGAPRLVNERGREVVLRDVADWLPVIVIDHPGVEGYVPDPGPVVLLRRDLEFLFQQLKSTHAVVEYLRRIAPMEPVVLGLESVRYYELAFADAVAEPGRLDPSLEGIAHARRRRRPLLPLAPAGHDERYHAIVRVLLEDLATAPIGDVGDESDRLLVLGAIDSLPVAYRAETGRTILDWLDEIPRPSKGGPIWKVRSHIIEGRPYLLIGAGARDDDDLREAFGGLVTLRHVQMGERNPVRSAGLTVGVLLTPRSDGQRPWDTTLVAARGPVALDPDHRALLERAWGPFGGRASG
jgi:hypothetical protein